MHQSDKQRQLSVLSYDYAFMSARDEEDVKQKRKTAQQCTRLLVRKGCEVEGNVCALDTAQRRESEFVEFRTSQ